MVSPSRISRRRSYTPSSDVCVHCRVSKQSCEPHKPCRRCVRKGCADTCVSWRETQMASSGEEGAAEAIGVPCSKDGVLVADQSRASKRKPSTPSSDVCVHCRVSKLGCEPDKPCRRCVRKGCADTCVSWRETQMTSGGEKGAAGMSDEGAIAFEAGSMKAGLSSTASSWASEDLRDALGAKAAASAGTAGAKVAVDFEDTSMQWSDDDADDFSRGLKYLKTRPLPEDFVVPDTLTPFAPILGLPSVTWG